MSRLTASLALSLFLTLPGGLLADDTICNGTVTGSHDNVIVPEGAVCTLTDAFLNGNVKVLRNGGITISGRTFINGNVQSEDGGAYVRIAGPSVTVGGNLQIKYAYQASTVQSGTQIRGNLQYVENSGFLAVDGVFIRGDLQLFKNTGGASLTNNTIRQNMQCKENVPAPLGGGNRAGDKEDQCRRL
jgi:hypothetical protein